MIARPAIKVLLALVLGFPLLQAVLTWVAGLLGAMGDAAAADILAHINVGLRVAWLVSIVGLVVALAVRSVAENGEE
jgi:ABC-type transport system involved in cytochrome bd biosynthesis fused ATPase/permease subunit